VKKILLILLCLPFIGFGQDFKKSFEIGGLFGSSLNNTEQNFTSDNLTKESIRSFTEGVALQYNISPLISYNCKIMYHIKGVQYYWKNITRIDITGTTIGSTNLDEKNTHHYLSFPIILRFKLGGGLKFFGDIGFYSGYLLKSIQEMSYPALMAGGLAYPEQNQKNEIPLDNINRVDFGGILGAGFSYVISEKIVVLFEYSSHIGLTDFSSDKYSYYNRSHTLTLGCSYNLTSAKK
jgi:opacity protein-like surface antigen